MGALLLNGRLRPLTATVNAYIGMNSALTSAAAFFSKPIVEAY